MKNHCLECGGIISGRSDKKFCNDSCRNAFHNRISIADRKLVRATNNILNRNRKILLELLPARKKKVSRQQLNRLGFNFQFYTNSSKTREGVCYYCYDIGYVPIEESEILLVRDDMKGNLLQT